MDESKIRLNTQGRVRPRKYNSKYAKLRKPNGDDVSENQQQNSETEMEHTIQHTETPSSPTQKCETEHIEGHTETSTFLHNETVEEDTIYHILHEGDGEEINAHAEPDLFDFMRQKDDVLDELMSKIREDNKWDPCDIDNFEEIDEDASTNHDSGDNMDEDSPVQPGHSMSLKTAVLVIWLFAITHSLTSCQLSDLLTLINLFMLTDNPVFKSLYRFKKVFQNFRSQFVKHYYCRICHTPVSEQLVICPNGACSTDLSIKHSKDYFLELPLSMQLENLFSRSEFRSGLKHRHQRTKKKCDNIEDVYDSDMYKELSSPGAPLSKKNDNNISFTLNTDGVPIFKSSKFSIWPIFLMINELPFKMRKNQNYMLLSGLWFGQDKPLVNMFCQPLHHSLIELEKGIDINIKSGDQSETIPVKGFLFCLSCDTPARSMMLNMNQHNGEYACPKCLQKGCNHRTSAGGNIRIFPYDTESPAKPERSHQQCLSDAEESVKTNTVVNGIKGPSFLMFCPKFDCVKNIGIDYMHLLCLGTVRLLLKLWFGVAHRLEEFSLYRLTDIVDSRLTVIKPPHFISRSPRTITDHLKFWKASELRSWLFFYSLPCVMDLLKPQYLYHYCCLVEGIFLLNQASISVSDIERSEKLLNYFVFMFPVLYGERYLTINIHSLVHLSKTVQQLGPLWCVSCFSFESANGELLKLFHGTQYIDVQIVNAVHIHQLLPSLLGSLSANSPAAPFVTSLLRLNESHSGYYVIGRCQTLELSPELRVLVCGFLERPALNVTYHSKACIRGITYCSKHYSDKTMRNSYTVKFVKDGLICFGHIIWFAHYLSDSSANSASLSENISFCCISILKEKPVNIYSMNHEGVKPNSLIQANFLNLDLNFVHVMKSSEEFVIVPLTSILDMCICIVVDDIIFVCEEPNHHELNL